MNYIVFHNDTRFFTCPTPPLLQLPNSIKEIVAEAKVLLKELNEQLTNPINNTSKNMFEYPFLRKYVILGEGICRPRTKKEYLEALNSHISILINTTPELRHKKLTDIFEIENLLCYMNQDFPDDISIKTLREFALNYFKLQLKNNFSGSSSSKNKYITDLLYQHSVLFSN